MRNPIRAKTNLRRGSVLVVVLTMITMFSVAAVAFIYFAEKEAVSSRLNLDSQHEVRPNMDTLLGFALNQLCYDTNLPNSAMRTHGLAVNMFGVTGSVPFNGIGRRHFADRTLLLGQSPQDSAYFPNFAGAAGASARAYNEATHGRLNAPYTYPDHNNVYLGAQRGRDGVVIARSFIRPVVFNNLPSQGGRPFVFDPYDPNPLIHNWFWGTGGFPANNLPLELAALRGNPNLCRAMVMRPGPWDHPNFPRPEDAGGDVKCLPAGTAVLLPDGVTLWYGNDSIWIDLDYPVQTDPATGKRFKPLFAFFITDLDNRVNLNVHGNIGSDLTQVRHQSNHGVGAYEVALYRVLQAGDWTQGFLGINPTVTTAPKLTGRYGLNGIPSSNPSFWSPGNWTAAGRRGYVPHVYAQLDWDNNATAPPTLPAAVGDLPFPTFPAQYQNGDPLNERGEQDPNNNNARRVRPHPAKHNPFAGASGDRLFKAQMLEPLLRHGDTGADAFSSDLRYLFNASILDPATRRRITTDSWDISRPGLLPYIDHNANRFGYRGNDLNEAPRDLSGGIGIPFPAQAQPLQPTPIPVGSVGRNHEFAANNWSYNGNVTSHVDLDRFLPPYPHLGRGTSGTATNATQYDHTPIETTRFDGSAGYQQFTLAQWERQRFARDIYNRLIQVTGVPPCVDADNPTPNELAARRWLAQLAVNMVDYIDEDDIATPMFFYGPAASPAPPTGTTNTLPQLHPVCRFRGTNNSPTLQNLADVNNGNQELYKYWVFGTELPKVTLSEAMVEFEQRNRGMGMGKPPTAGPVDVRVYVELFNAMAASGPATTQQRDYQPVPLHVPAVTMGQAPYAPYKVVVASPNANRNGYGPMLRGAANENVLGTPEAALRDQGNRNVETTDQDFQRTTRTIGGNQVATAISPQQFFLIGANQNTFDDTLTDVGPSNQALTNVPWVQSQAMQFQRTVNPRQNGNGFGPFAEQDTGVSVLLRRLTNPFLPYDPNPVIQTAPGVFSINSNFNPYLTVDYMESVPISERQNRGNGVGVGLGESRSVGKRRAFESSLTQVVQQRTQRMVVQNMGMNMQETPTNTYHTLGTANDLRLGPTWLVHLDRQPISPMEMLHVSGCKPHELTQQFGGTYRTTTTAPITAGQPVTLENVLQVGPSLAGTANLYKWQIQEGNQIMVDIGDQRETQAVTVDAMTGKLTATFNKDHAAGVSVVGVSKVGFGNNPPTPIRYRFNHYAPWFDEERRLYRVFELLECFHRRPGATQNGRTPGRININTVWREDPEVFLALCDANAANYFDDAEVNRIFQQFAQQRTPRGLPSVYDRPIWGYMPGKTPSTGPLDQYPNYKYPRGFGINDTLAGAWDRSTDSNQQYQDPERAMRLLDVYPQSGNDPTHPYVKANLMTKIFNNVTTRSNVFAVWVTVGFFEVDSSGRLGQEIGRIDNRHRRYRGFAIIDRTLMQPTGNFTGTDASGNTGTTTRTALTVDRFLGQSRLDPRGANVPVFETVTINSVAYTGTTTYALRPVIYWSIIE